MVNISVNSGFDRSQDIPDNVPVSAYRETMAAVGSSARSRRAQVRSGPTRPIPVHLCQSDDESGPSEDGHEHGDASSKEDDDSS